MDRNTPTTVVDKPVLAQVVQGMVKYAHQGKQDLEIRRLVEQICAGIESGDYASEILAIYNWVYANIRYIRDIHDVEFVKWPRETVRTRAGDCDDMATLIAAMVMTAGNPVRFILASFDGAMPSHVYAEAITPDGPVILDPVANSQTSEMLQRMKKRWIVPVS